MKTAIVYVSMHHENTKKLVKAIYDKFDLDLYNGTSSIDIDLNEYDCIGFASGIAYGNFYPIMTDIITRKLPKNKKVFFIYTCGTKNKKYTKNVSELAKKKECEIVGEFGCLGYDTYGILKLFGGIKKGHPTEEDINNAINFYETKINSLN